MSVNSPVGARRLAAMSRETTSPARDDVDLTKHGRLNPDFIPVPSGSNSPVDSPMLRRAAVSLLLGVPASDLNDDSVASWSLDETTTTDESSRASPGPESPGPYAESMGREAGDISPEPSVTHRHTRKHYRNELWSAIKSDYMSLMDEGIIDACKSTESELSSDDLSSESKVSYNEFLQQCRELTDWLGHLQLNIQRKTDSRSENYLDQMYHEEMLNQSPRQRLINDYARQLLRRYPHLKAEITLRLNHVNTLWTEVIDRLVLPPGAGCRDPHTMLADIQEDLSVLRQWVNRMERTLVELHIDDKWPVSCLKEKFTEHQNVQKDIESRSRVVTAILKLCEWLSSAEPERADVEPGLAEVQYDAGKLEQRWHGVWIQSVEWQLRLEDAIAGKNTKRLPVHNIDETDLSRLSSVCQSDVVPRVEQYSTHVVPHGHSDHESDVGSSDVIPFRDSEYEEVGDDDLMFQFNGSSDSEPEAARRSDSINELLDYNVMRVSPEVAMDSALSRSVSDPSLRTSGAAPQRATVEFLRGCQVVRTDVPDVGYSSEWQSNEEADNSTATQPPSCEQSLGAAAAAGCDEERVSEAECRQENIAEICVLPDHSNILRISSLASRHSATSAYNSSNSDLSDCHHRAARRLAAGNNEAAGVSDIDLIAVPDFYCLTSVDQSISYPAESSSSLFPSMHREARGDETDEDVARMMELPLDEIPSPRIPVHWGDFPDGHCGYQRRIYGRSLDSLAPLATDKLFTAEKRVSSVEVIIDSMSSGATPVEENKVFAAAAKSGIPRHRRGKNALSSCDASSEGTISDSDSSEQNASSEDDNHLGSGRKRRVYAKRSQKSVRVSPAKSSSSLPVKSPTKRRVDSLTDPAVLVLGEGLPRSVSDGEIVGKFGVVGCKRSKLSRVMICGSPKSGAGRGKKVVASVDGVRSGATKKKVANTCTVLPNSHVRALDFNDVEPTRSALSADEEMLASYPQIPGVAMVTSDADAMVPDLNGSLTSVTNDQSWNDEYQNMYDSSDVNHRVVDNILSDDWCDSAADDLSMDANLYDDIDDIKQVREPGMNRRRPSKGSSRAPPASAWMDSDSDTEDFLNIVSESRKAFHFTESTLTQFSRDHTAGVIVRDPAEYMGPLATCQTNVKCLLELVEALESGGQVNDASNKIRQITEIVRRWRDLEAQTVTQQHECRQLFILHVERVRLERELDMMARDIDFDRFDDIDSLENTLRMVQGVSSELCGRVNEQLTALAHRVDRYNESHPAVELSRLVAAIESLYQTHCHLSQRCESTENQLKTSLMAWHQLNELERHLVYVLNHEQHQLECLGVATDIVGLSQQDCQETVHDLKSMRDGWSAHSSKLRLMESLFAEVGEVCTVHAQTALRDALNAVSTDLHTLYTHCDKIVARVEQTQHENDGDCNVSSNDCIDGMDSDVGESVSSAAAIADTSSAVTDTVSRSTTESDMQTDDTIYAQSRPIDEIILEKLSSFEEKLLSCSTPRKPEKQKWMDDETFPLEKVPVDLLALRMTEKAAVRPTVALKAGSPSQSLLRRLLKYALPLPFLMILLFGSLYLLFDDWFAELDRYGLVINPQMQHVRGAPPI